MNYDKHKHNGQLTGTRTNSHYKSIELFSKRMLQFVALVLLVTFQSCGTKMSEPNVDDATLSTEQPSQLLQEQLVWLSGYDSIPSNWASNIRDVCESLPDIECLACFSNHLDTSQVYALLRASKDAENDLKSICTDGASTCEFYFESIPVDIDAGDGAHYLFVSHQVKDLSVWHTSFMSMYTYKEANSIYTLGVLNHAEDSLRVTVLSRTPELGNASEYAGMIESKGIMRQAGVHGQKTSMVLRRL